jgi:hypothetical protein
MMTSFVLAPQPFRRGPSPAEAVVVGVASVVAVMTLFVAGVTFFGLAVAPVAEAFHVHIRVAEGALSGRLIDFWWVFAGLSLASFTGAAMVAGKAVEYLSPAD